MPARRQGRSGKRTAVRSKSSQTGIGPIRMRGVPREDGRRLSDLIGRHRQLLELDHSIPCAGAGRVVRGDSGASELRYPINSGYQLRVGAEHPLVLPMVELRQDLGSPLVEGQE